MFLFFFFFFFFFFVSFVFYWQLGFGTHEINYSQIPISLPLGIMVTKVGYIRIYLESGLASGSGQDLAGSLRPA
jgi:hypothetical protein